MRPSTHEKSRCANIRAGTGARGAARVVALFGFVVRACAWSVPNAILALKLLCGEVESGCIHSATGLGPETGDRSASARQ